MGRKYGLGKYGRGTYDLYRYAPPWVPIPVDPGEIWVPEAGLPPGNWVPTSGPGSEVWAPVVASEDPCWGGKRTVWEEKWASVIQPVLSNG